MKQFLLLLFTGFLLSAQVTNEGKPRSWKILDKNESQQTSIKMPSFNLKVIEQEDAINDLNKSIPYRFGYKFEVDLGIQNAGTWHEMPNGDRIWRILIESEGAQTLNFIFDEFYMPKGANVYLYSDDRSDILGAYNATQNQPEEILGTWLVSGDKVWIEYYEPKEVLGQGKLHLSTVTHGYRSKTYEKEAKALNDSGNCNLDVDCSIGADHDDKKDHNKNAVVLLISGGSSFCSGAMVNNTNNDQTPYILTANHCLGNVSAWSFRFGWISPNPVCATTSPSTNGPTNMTISGATLRASNANSDVALVQINSAVPSSWNRTWAGWSRSTTAPPYVVGIHHPAGDIMKVCRDNSGVIQATNAGAQTWEITTAGGGWEMGVTEGGSSGSPLFNDQGLIIGQLYGGGAACSGTTDNGLLDYYGRFDVSWNAGSSASSRLRDWLDPSNTGVTTQPPYPALETFNLDASITSNTQSPDCAENTTSPSFILQNSGQTTLTSATINWSLNGGVNNVINWTGSLAANQTETINTGSTISLNAGSNAINVEVTNPNGGVDENNLNNASTQNLVLDDFYNTSEINISITLDNYPDETTWSFKNSNGTILASGGPYTTDGATVSTDVTVSLGDCYEFEIFDDYSDGICCGYGNGSYTLSTADGTVIQTGGEFGASEKVNITVAEELSVIDFRILDKIEIYPIPASDRIFIKNLPTGEFKYQLYDTSGRLVKEGKYKEYISVNNLSQGVYQLIIRSEEQSIHKKVIIK